MVILSKRLSWLRGMVAPSLWMALGAWQETCVWGVRSIMAEPLPALGEAKTPNNGKSSYFNIMSEGEVLRFLQKCIRTIREASIDPIDNNQIIEGALQGVLQHLDPHSAYFPPDKFAEMNEQLSGEMCGVGVVFTKTDQGLCVIACIDDTPAAKAGLRSGDCIVAVDDVIVGSSNHLSDVSIQLKGKMGSSVKISVMRKGEKKPLHFHMIRERIKLTSVKHRIVEHIGLIRVAHFDQKTASLLRSALKSVQKSEGKMLQGLIIDLRNNPGGSVKAAVDCCRLFINKGPLLKAKGRRDLPEEVNYASGTAMAPSVPVVILIDAGTASAAEMMAGALQDHRVALVMGVTSFGKGTAQVLLEVPHPRGGGGLKITTQRWYTPKGKPIQGRGITPDIVVEAMEEPKLLSDGAEQYRERDMMGSLRAEKSAVPEGSLPAKAMPSTPIVVSRTKVLEEVKIEYDYQMERAKDMIRGLHWKQSQKQDLPVPVAPSRSS